MRQVFDLQAIFSISWPSNRIYNSWIRFRSKSSGATYVPGCWIRPLQTDKNVTIRPSHEIMSQTVRLSIMSMIIIEWSNSYDSFYDGFLSCHCCDSGSSGTGPSENSTQKDQQNAARIANAVQCHNKLSGNNDCHESRFSIVCIVISVSNVTSSFDCSIRMFSDVVT